MKTIILDDMERIETSGHSSKGNQLKWKNDDYWYKADYMGYEGLAEILISRLMEKSNINNYVKYEPAKLVYKGIEYNGCRSKNFLCPNEELVTIEKLFRQYTGRSLAKELPKMQEVGDRIVYVVENVKRFTGLNQFGKYLSTALTLDTFFLNEDRHTNNIAVIYDSVAESYRLCPYFDNGLALLSDTKTDFGIMKDIEVCKKIIEAKPFSRDFDEQLDEIEQLYGQEVRFTFSIKDILKELDELKMIYDERIRRRVENVLRGQIRKYAYLMQS